MSSSQKDFKIALLLRVSPLLTAHSIFVRFLHLVCWSSQLLFKFLAYWWGTKQQRNERDSDRMQTKHGLVKLHSHGRKRTVEHPTYFRKKQKTKTKDKRCSCCGRKSSNTLNLQSSFNLISRLRKWEKEKVHLESKMQECPPFGEFHSNRIYSVPVWFIFIIIKMAW